MNNETLPPPRRADSYRGIPSLLRAVRWGQHFLSILAEVLILLSFAMSGMDVSLGGVMAGIPLLKILWAGMFALGIDTAFVLSWVRVRRASTNRQWVALAWNVLLALGLSGILFQPIAIQLLQQSLDINFAQAVGSLGINIVILTYARAAVAVFLGAILALTNVESEMSEQPLTVSPKRKVLLFEQLLDKVAPVITEERSMPELPERVDIAKVPTYKLPAIASPILEPLTTTGQASTQVPISPEERAARVGELNLGNLSPAERVTKVLTLFPDVSDRELGKLSGVSAATAKKYRITYS